MKKLKIILLFSYFFISIYVILTLKQNKIIEEEYVIIKGIVTEYQETDKYLKIVIQTDEKIIGYYYGDNKYDLKLGEELILKGNIKLPEANRNFYLFNYKNYLKSKRIFKIINIEEIYITNKEINLIYKIKNLFLNRINSFKYTKKYMSLFLYGENNLEETLNIQYKNLGIIHLFAISGMHISLFKKILETIFKKIKQKDIIIIVFLFFYLILAKSSPSITRAVLTENIYLICKKEINKKEILKFVFFLFLLINPYNIYSIGFQLSFLISYTFISFKINNQNKLINTFKTSIIAFLVSAPIIINQNFELNLLTPIYNLIFIPFVTTIVFPITIITFIFSPLEPVLMIIIQILELLVNLSNNVPFGVINLGYLETIPFIVAYFLIYITLKNKKYLILVIIFFLLHYFKNNIFHENKLIMIDVNQGDSVLIQGEKNILIDTGGRINQDISEEIIIPVLKSRGIHQIDFLILTHGDYDHIGGSINLVNNFKVEKVIFNCGKFNDLEKELIKLLNKKKIKYYSCIKELNIDNNKLHFLQTKEYDNENDNSSVIYTKLNNHKFLFMGDAGGEIEKNLIKKYNLQDIEVLKVGHHGSIIFKIKNNKLQIKTCKP